MQALIKWLTLVLLASSLAAELATCCGGARGARRRQAQARVATSRLSGPVAAAPQRTIVRNVPISPELIRNGHSQSATQLNLNSIHDDQLLEELLRRRRMRAAAPNVAPHHTDYNSQRSSYNDELVYHQPNSYTQDHAEWYGPARASARPPVNVRPPPQSYTNRPPARFNRRYGRR